MQRSSPYRHADSTDTPRSALSGTPRSTTGVNTPRRDHGLRPSRGPSKSSIADTRHASSALDEELDPHPYFVAAFLRLALVVTGYVLTKSPSILLILIFNLIAVEAREIVVSRYAVNVEMMVKVLLLLLSWLSWCDSSCVGPFSAGGPWFLIFENDYQEIWRE